MKEYLESTLVAKFLKMVFFLYKYFVSKILLTYREKNPLRSLEHFIQAVRRILETN